MLRTRVGYSGGTKAHPNYHDLGDHTESVEVDYDPRKLSFEQLVAIYAGVPGLNSPSWSRQYRNAVFYHDEHQRRAALKALQGTRVEVEAYRNFTLAEDYHQKYYLQNSPLMSQYRGLDLVNSTAAARVNGYLVGFAKAGQLQQEMPRLGLSHTGQQMLVQLAHTPAVHCQ